MLGPVLRGHKISLEPAQPEDALLRHRWFADLEVTRLYTSPGVPSLKQEEESFDRAARDDSAVLWRITLNGVAIGQCFLHQLDWMHRQTLTGTWIGERAHWRKGYGSESVRLRTDYALGELGLERIETSSIAANIGMHRALERSGFRRIGVRTHRYYYRGEWHDEYIFELLRDEWLKRAATADAGQPAALGDGRSRTT
jgi:RimJ/RimL family protein N-acetyltransferase